MSKTVLEQVYRMVMAHDGVVSMRKLKEAFPDYALSSGFNHLQKVHGVKVIRLDDDLHPIPESISRYKRGQQTTYIRFAGETSPTFRENYPSPGERKEMHEDHRRSSRVQIRDSVERWRTPCYLPLVQHTRCFHGKKCANGHACPIATAVRDSMQLYDRRSEARRDLERAGWKKGWAFQLNGAE